MASSCNQESGTVNVKNLPHGSEIVVGDYIIIESGKNSRTEILNFEDFVIGLDNTSFKTSFLSLQSDATYLGGLSSGWESTYTTVQAKSGLWAGFDPDNYNIVCWDTVCTLVSANSANWTNAFNWGNHATMGYDVELDPTVPQHVKGISTSDISRWNSVSNLAGSAGCAEPNKAIVADSNKDVRCLRNIDVTGNITVGGTRVALISDIPANAGSGSPIPHHVVLTSTQNWTVPADVTRIRVYLIGGGGGGAERRNNGNNGSGGSGGAGGYVDRTLTVTPGDTIRFEVGHGGAAGPYGRGWGDPGGRSTFTYGNVTCIAGGGGGAKSDGSNGDGGTATGGDFNVPGNGIAAFGVGGYTTGYGAAATDGHYFGSGGYKAVYSARGGNPGSGKSGLVRIEY